MSVRPLTANMKQALLDIGDGKDPCRNLHGQSQHGGWQSVMFGLIRRGLIDGDWKLTEAGAEEFRRQRSATEKH